MIRKAMFANRRMWIGIGSAMCAVTANARWGADDRLVVFAGGGVDNCAQGVIEYHRAGRWYAVITISHGCVSVLRSTQQRI